MPDLRKKIFKNLDKKQHQQSELNIEKNLTEAKPSAEQLQGLKNVSNWEAFSNSAKNAWNTTSYATRTTGNYMLRVTNSTYYYLSDCWSDIKFSYNQLFPQKTQIQIDHEQTIQREKNKRSIAEQERKLALKNRKKIIQDSYNKDISQLDRELDICKRWNEDERAFLNEINNRLSGEAFYENGTMKPVLEAKKESHLRSNRAEVLYEDMQTTVNQHKLETKSSQYDNLCAGLDSRINQLSSEKKLLEDEITHHKKVASNVPELVENKLQLNTELQNIKEELTQCLAEKAFEIKNAAKLTVPEIASGEDLALITQDLAKPNRYIENMDNPYEPISNSNNYNYDYERIKTNLRDAKSKSDIGMMSDELKLILSRFINLALWPRYLVDSRSWIYSEFSITPSLKLRYGIAFIVGILWMKILLYLLRTALDYLFYKPTKVIEIEEPAFRPWSRVPRGGDFLKLEFIEDALPFFIIKMIQVRDSDFININHNEKPNPISKIYKIGSKLKLPLNIFLKQYAPIIGLSVGIWRGGRSVEKPPIHEFKPAMIRDISQFQFDDQFIDTNSLNIKSSNGIVKLKLEHRRRPLTMKEFDEKSGANKKPTPCRDLSKLHAKKKNQMKQFKSLSSTEESSIKISESSSERFVKIKNDKLTK